MRIKKPNNISGCRFWMDDPETGEPFSIPYDDRGAPNLPALTQMVVKQIGAFDKAGYNYSEKAREEASKQGMTFSAYMRKVIEHQICLRGEIECWNDGFGDVLHSISGKIDSTINKSPKQIKSLLKSVTKGITKAATGKSSHSLSGCSVCGGTRSFNKNVNNLGRAGKLNKKG